jgi:hypothetical protein
MITVTASMASPRVNLRTSQYDYQREGVLAVTADELQTMTTSSTPTFLGVTEPGGSGINWV